MSWLNFLYWPVKLISSQSFNLDGHVDRHDDIAPILFIISLSSDVLRESLKPISVHYLILSSHFFLYRPLRLVPFTVPCRIVFAVPEELKMWQYHLSFRLFAMGRRSSCNPIATWILLRTSDADTTFMVINVS